MSGERRWFVGCACDSAFVRHTCVMLTSLALNGNVPEATIVVAAFDFAPVDYVSLRAHAGRIGARIEFIDVTPEMLGAIADQHWESHYPPAILGRLFLASSIDVAGARLLTLDSDMIVNVSVRPLFELDMLGSYLAATHDPPRQDDPSYFNSGMMVIDLDRYRSFDVTRRSLRWLAEQDVRPRYPDQDALNMTVGHQWYRLDRRWNWAFCGPEYGDAPLTSDSYQQAFIAHFTGQGKPWNSPDHAGRALYRRYLEEYNRQADSYRASLETIDSNFIVTLMEVFLGRLPVDHGELNDYISLSALEAVAALIRSEEFAANTFLSVKLDVDPPAELYNYPVVLRHKLWVSERIPLSDEAISKVVQVQSWLELLRLVLFDPIFVHATGLRPMTGVVDKLLGSS